ncbi:MFS transporter [Paenibacillus yanchengensis]|uniref:MFS transporter n=1 Tax=Paenibacillus yanchengensis TaxID=2035833 RepID=A0ABW4YIP8_9BACL
MLLFKKREYDPYLQLKLFNLFMFGSWSLLNPFLPIYFQNIGFTNLQIGLLMSMGPMISIVANPFWGYWSDRTQNTRLILLIMLTGNIILSQIYFQLSDFVLILIVMIIFYSFQTALNPLTSSLIFQTIQGTPYSFGTFRLWGSLGFAIIILIASPVIQWLGVENLGYLYGVFVLITLLLGFKLPKKRKQISAKKGIGKDMFSLLTQPVFILFLIFVVLLSIPNAMNSTFIAVFITELGGSEVSIGWSWFIAAIIEIPIFLLLDRYLQTSARIMFGLMVVVGLLYTLRWILMAISTAPIHIMFIQVFHSFTFGITMYTVTQLCNYLVPKHLRTSGQALNGLFMAGISGMVGGLLGGQLFDHFNAPTMYFTGVGLSIVATIGFLGLWIWFTTHRDLDREAE